jgi:hypothetical protein
MVAPLRAGLAWVRAKVPLELADAAEQGRLLGLAEPVGPGDFGLVQSGQEAFEGFLSAAGHLDQDAAAVGRVGVAAQQTANRGLPHRRGGARPTLNCPARSGDPWVPPRNDDRHDKTVKPAGCEKQRT